MQITIQDASNGTVLSLLNVGPPATTNLYRMQHVINLSKFLPNTRLYFQVSYNLEG